MPLGMEVGLGPGHIMLDGDPAPLPKKGAQPPPFSADVCCGQTAEWIKMPLDTRPHSVTWGPSSPLEGESHVYSAHVYCGQTVAHLSYC